MGEGEAVGAGDAVGEGEPIGEGEPMGDGEELGEGAPDGDADGPVAGLVEGRGEGVALAVGRGEGSKGVWLGTGSVLPPPPPPQAARMTMISAEARPRLARVRMSTPEKAKKAAPIVAAAALPGQGASDRLGRALRAAASPTSARGLSDYGDKGVPLRPRLITATPPPAERTSENV